MKIAFFGLKEQEKKDYFKNSLAGHEIVFIDQDLNEDSLPKELNFDIISIFIQSKATPKVIDAFPNLKMIAVRATGFDNVDLKHAKEKNITVANVPSYGSHTVAEFTFGLILSISRKIPQAITKVKDEVEFDHEGLKGFDLYGKTLGVIGTGKIGANVIKIAKGFGMIILAYDTFPNLGLAQTFNFNYVTLEQVLKDSDIVTIHVPAAPQTHHLINKDNIFQMKKGSILINTARGDVIDTDALYQALADNHLTAAGLDVLEGEANLNDNPDKQEFEPLLMKGILENSQIIKNPHVIVTPHAAFYTTEAEQAIMQTTVENIQGYAVGLPKNVVKQ